MSAKNGHPGLPFATVGMDLTVHVVQNGAKTTVLGGRDNTVIGPGDSIEKNGQFKEVPKFLRRAKFESKNFRRGRQNSKDRRAEH